MPIPSSNFFFSDIRNELNGSIPIYLSDYYNKLGKYAYNFSCNIPSSNTIYLGNFSNTSINNNISITGVGNIINTSSGIDNYYYAYFTNNGTFSVNSNTYCDILLVGGGGGGGNSSYNDNTGNYWGGGGGGGDVIFKSSYLLSSNTYTINIGMGGSTLNNNNGFNGGITSITCTNNNSFIPLFAGGGGGGAYGTNNGNSGVGIGTTNINYSSGGGGGGVYTKLGGSGNSVSGDGFTPSINSIYTGGGGGAIGSAIEGNGGSGYISNITGTNITYGIGGNGANTDVATVGIPGTSYISLSYNSSFNGANNSGNGGNGSSSAYYAGNGGSGVVIIKFLTYNTIVNDIENTTININTVVNNNNYKYAIFSNSGIFTLNNNITCDIFMIGGGGGGGYNHGGGGGAGAYYYGTNITLNSGIYNITVGNGGKGGTITTSPQNGGDTSINYNGILYTINGLSAICKGGGGAGMYNISNGLGQNGGCGGGADGFNETTTLNSVISGGSTNNTGTIGTGFAGGTANQYYSSQQLAAGGGGGISTVGFNANLKEGGNGGNGLVINITGTENVFGGGGGGGEWPSYATTPAGLGGGATLTNGTFIYVGGNAQRNENQNGGDAVINTGSGGGGGKYARGGNGSSGIFIIKYNVNSNIIFNYNTIVTGTNNIIKSVNNNSNYNYALFTTSGSLIMKNNLYCDVLLVGGGGGGGRQNTNSGGGGGGGGGVGIGKINFKSNIIYNITIGSGGLGDTTLIGGSNGGNTSIIGGVINEIAYGGGGGGTSNGLNGGSGGGASAPSVTQTGGNATKGLSLSGNNNAIMTYYGNSGGNSIYNNNLVRGGGGGGAANSGEISSSSYGGQGGNGILSTITGIETYYGAGGGGGAGVGGGGIGLGGLGGGGNGGSSTITPTDGTSNSGSGGGGSSINIAGNGGSGVVIIKYPVNYPIITGNNNFINTTNDNINYSYAFFSNSGTLTIKNNIYCDILVIGGGGGGGSKAGPGGGAGALIYKTNYTLLTGTYSINIGLGGLGGINTGQNPGLNGDDTSIIYNNTSTTIFLAKGGGGASAGGAANGTNQTADTTYNGNNGGSGGGAYKGGTAGIKVLTNIPQDSDVYANDGGTWTTSISYGGGGGGAGGVGIGGTVVNLGNGGLSKLINITGTPTYYAGGGGAGNRYNGYFAGFGGVGISGTSSSPSTNGGAGDGGSQSYNGNNAIDNTGSGGGGGGYGGTEPGGSGGNGGSGVVIIRFPNVEPLNIQYETSNLYINSNSYCIFNDLSNINIPANSNYNINFNSGIAGIGETPYYVPWGAYFASDFSGNILYDSSGNGRHATTTGTITYAIQSGNGSTGAIHSISGNTTATITWPVGSVPTNFTILSLTRYTGTVYVNRILSTKTGNWLQGHWTAKRGVAYYEGWKTSSTNSIGTLTNWLCMIGKNSGSIPTNILADGTGIGNATGGSGNNYQLAINNINYTSEKSDWSLSCVIIYDTILTDAHMSKLNNFINSYKLSGNINTLKSNILRFINTNILYKTITDNNGNNITPTAWYKFDNNTNLGLDSMGTYTLTNYNSVTYDSNIYKKGSGSALFNGTNSYLLGTGVNINNISFSISFWVYPTGVPATTTIYSKDNNTTLRQSLHIAYTTSMTIFKFGFYGDDLDIKIYNHSYKWNFFVCTYNYSNNQQITYCNGVLAGSRTTGGALNAPDQNYNIGRIFNATGYLSGYLDDLRIYRGVVLTPRQVLDLYNGTIQIYQ